MAKLTQEEILNELGIFYSTKQELAALADSLDSQAVAINAQALSDIQAIRVAQQPQRDLLLARLAQSDVTLNRGK